MNTEKKPNKKKLIPILLIVAICIMFLAGYFQGYHDAIGGYPSAFKQTILPPELDSVDQSFEQVTEFIKNDSTDKLEYKQGFNCVDYVFMVLRHANWNGIIAIPIMITFDDSSEHMIVMMPTNDKGTVLFETMTDKQVDPQIGNLYMGKRVTGLYGLATGWIPLNEYRQGVGW